MCLLLLDWAPAPATPLCLLTVLLPCVCLIFGTDNLSSTVDDAVTLLLSNLCVNTAAMLSQGVIDNFPLGDVPSAWKVPCEAFHHLKSHKG